MGCPEYSQVPMRFLRQVRDVLKYYRQGNKQTQVSKPHPGANKNPTFPLQAVPDALCKAIIYILSQLGITSIVLLWLEKKKPLIYFRGKVCFLLLESISSIISLAQLAPQRKENELHSLLQRA